MDDTIRADVFNALNALFIANKPTYVYGGVTYTYTIKSAYPEENPTFPMIIINPSIITPKILVMGQNSFVRTDSIEIEIEFYAKAEHGKRVIDVARDSIMALIFDSEATLASDYDLFLGEEPIDDSNVDTLIEGSEKINTAGMLVRFHR